MNAKIYNGNVQPNHKEYKIWVNDEGVIKTWNGTEWIESTSSGGSGSGGDDNNSFEYIEISSISYDSNLYDPFVSLSHLCKCDFNGKVEILPSGLVADLLGHLGSAVHELRNGSTAVMVNLNEKITSNGAFFTEGTYTIKDFLINMVNISEEMLNSLPRITEEEFYNLDNIESEK